MRFRLRTAASLIALCTCSFAGATGAVSHDRIVSYGGATPEPRTTDSRTLHALANDREILERMRVGFGAESDGRWDLAKEQFARVLTLHPREPQASTSSYDLGIALVNLGDASGAIASFQDAIVRDPGFLAARANLVGAELALGDLPAARRAADAFVAAAPTSARALYARGLVALRAGDAATARADFTALVASDPAYPVAHFNLAMAEEETGDYADAERELRAALAAAPTYARASIALGTILLHEGSRGDARAAFDEAARTTGDVTLRNLATSMRDAIQQ